MKKWLEIINEAAHALRAGSGAFRYSFTDFVQNDVFHESTDDAWKPGWYSLLYARFPGIGPILVCAALWEDDIKKASEESIKHMVHVTLSTAAESMDRYIAERSRP